MTVIFQLSEKRFAGAKFLVRNKKGALLAPLVLLNADA